MNEKTSSQFYGRRKGRPLRQQKQMLFDELLPPLQVHIRAGDTNIDPKAFFPVPPKAVWLEIGFGGGEHLAALAEQHPEVGFLGSEVFVNGVASFLEHLEAKKLTNVRLFPDDVRSLLRALKPQSLEKIIVLFPDPWPKARHNKRRLIQKDTLEIFAHLLVEKGELRLASDHPDYVAWMREEIKKVPALTLAPPTETEDGPLKPPTWPATRYEDKAARQGITSTYFSLIKG